MSVCRSVVLSATGFSFVKVMHSPLVISENCWIIISEVCMPIVNTKADALAVFARKKDGTPVSPELSQEYERALEADQSSDPTVWAAIFVAVWARTARKPSTQSRLSS